MDDSAARTYCIRVDELERLRQAKGLSIERLASKAGVSSKTIRRWLRGKPGLIGYIETVADALGTTTDRLIVTHGVATDDCAGSEKFSFRYELIIEGKLITPEHALELLRLSPDAAAKLLQQGLNVSRQEASLSMACKSQDNGKLFVVLKGVRSDGRELELHALVKPDRYDSLLLAIATRTFDLLRFDLYGVILPNTNMQLSILEMLEYQQEDPLQVESDIKSFFIQPMRRSSFFRMPPPDSGANQNQ